MERLSPSGPAGPPPSQREARGLLFLPTYKKIPSERSLHNGAERICCALGARHQDLWPRRGQQGCFPGRAPRRDSGPAGRKRQRQDDPDEHDRRYLLPRRGRDLCRRQGGDHPLPPRRAGPGHRHDPPALQARGRVLRDGEYRPVDGQRREVRPEKGSRQGPRHLRKVRIRP